MKEPFQIPASEDIENLIGTDLYDVWNSLCQRIEKSYEMEQLWNRGGKAWTYEYKYRKGGKTPVLYMRRKRLWDLWLSWGKMNAPNSKFSGDSFQTRYR